MASPHRVKTDIRKAGASNLTQPFDFGTSPFTHDGIFTRTCVIKTLIGTGAAAAADARA